MIIHGDCVEGMKTLPDNSIDSIVTDPPYELGFMGKSWDSTGIAYSIPMWKECLRVLKPGGHLLAFSGTRTYHRMAVAIEDAGFDIRDQIAWCYGQGFPKSLNISLQIKKKYNIGLCTCNVFEPMLELGYENSNNKRDNISNGEDDRLGSGKQIQHKRDDNNEMEEQIKDTNLSPDNAFRKESRVCELSEKDNKKEQGFEKVSESILQSEVCKPISEKERLGNTTLRSGLEENKTTGEREGQSMSDMQNETTDGIAGSSLNTVQNGGQELNGELGRSLSQLPQQDRENNRKRVEQIKNDCNTEEWNNLSRFICSKCYCLKKDIGGTALKPSIEPICMARKPLAEKTVAENCLKYGTGGINIDESRVGTEKISVHGYKGQGIYGVGGKSSYTTKENGGETKPTYTEANGRFPANLIHDNSKEVRECFPDLGKSAVRKGGKGGSGLYEGSFGDGAVGGYTDSGNASRFFKSIIYQAKAPRSERLLNGFDCAKIEVWKNKDENMEVAVSLTRAILDLLAKNLNTVESGGNITAVYPKDFISTIRTTIKKITELKTWNLLTLSPTKDFIVDVFSKKTDGGNLVGYAENSNELMTRIGIFQEKVGLATEDVKNATYQSLLKISEKDAWQEAQSHHPTHKPIALMEYLIKMITPPKGVVLDPFTGSGSTGVACINTGNEFIGCELNDEYIPIIQARLGNPEVIKIEDIRELPKQTPKEPQKEVKKGLSSCCQADIVKGYCVSCCDNVV